MEGCDAPLLQHWQTGFDPRHVTHHISVTPVTRMLLQTDMINILGVKLPQHTVGDLIGACCQKQSSDKKAIQR